jgi:hypothetical protein
MRRTLLMTGLVALLSSACASWPTITTNASPDTDLSKFRTYEFMQPLSTDRSNGVRTPLSTMLIDSMSRELASRGLERSDSPDLLVNFFVNTEERMDVRSVPTSRSFHGYRRGRYSTWGTYRTTVREYTRGTLAVDLVDAATNVLVWEGVAQGRLRRGVRDITQEQLDAIIAQMMTEFRRSPN